MPLGTQVNSLRILLENLNTDRSSKFSFIKTTHDKPAIFPNDAKVNFLNRSKPHEHGIEDEYIQSFINEITSDLSIRSNRMLIIKDNDVIGEHYAYPYIKRSWDCVFSASKTVTALALGLLYDEGKVDLDLPVCKIIKNERNIRVARNKKITLRHLLTMSTGVLFNEMDTASSEYWCRDYFNTNAKFRLGSKFEYNSLNSYIIGVVIEALAGQKFEDLVKERIFKPLGISETYFDVSPEGYFKCGWGLYILPEDMAKLGILVRDNGMYNGQRVLSEEWIDMMSHTQYEATKFGHVLNYGFQMWTNDKDNYCCFNGMYDQNIFIFRNSGVIVVTCFADNECFHSSNLFAISSKYFASKKPGKFPLCETHGNRDLKNYDNLNYYYDQLASKRFVPTTKIANSCGVIPLLLQNEVSTYAEGIKSLTFIKDENENIVVVHEGSHHYHLKFRFDDGVRQVLNYQGNVYDVVIDGRFILSGKGEPFLVIRLFFLEFSYSRYISIKFNKNKNLISVELSENPGFDFVTSIIENQDESVKVFIKRWLNTLNPALVSGKIKNIFAPTFMATCGKVKYFLDSKKESSN